jgi:hypothetical protein
MITPETACLAKELSDKLNLSANAVAEKAIHALAELVRMQTEQPAA